MTHASLFSGIGGAELAASWMGWQNLFHCEIQEFPRKVLEFWYPKSISYEDITKTDFKKWRSRVDVLTGGFPCQPFSIAGKRAGADDYRYLWPKMLRAIREIQPAWVVGENVAGIISMVQPGEEIKVGRADNLFEQNYIYREEQEYTLSVICKDLERAGYAVQSFVIPACAVGAPHRRDRVWIVANVNCHGGQKNTKWNKKGCKAESKHEQIHIHRHIANAQSKRRDESKSYDGIFEETSKEKCRKQQPRRADCPQGWWRDFPTQPPVCIRDDGLPFDVADLAVSFPKWRQEAIKALGNAWVPQVAYEIFKAIEQLENIKNR